MKKFRWIIWGLSASFIIGATLITALIPNNAAAEPNDFSQRSSLLVQEYWDDDFIGNIKLTIDSEDVYINGVLTRFDSKDLAPALREGKVYLPVALVAELVAAAVTYEDDGNVVMATDKCVVGIFVGQEVISVNNVPQIIDTVPFVEGGRVMVPLEVMGFFGFDEPIWNAEQQELVLVKTYQMHRLVVMTNSGELTETYGAIQVIEDSDGMYVLQYDSEQAAREADRRFKEDPNIIFSQPDAVIYTDSVTAQATGGLSWGVERVGANFYTEQISNKQRGNTIVVAVIDTGIDFDHPFLAGRISETRWNFVGGNNNPYDVDGHGTHVSGIIIDATPPNVIIMPLKVLNDDGEGSALDMYNAAVFAVDSGADVINMSLGGHMGWDTRSWLDEKAIDYALANNVLVVVSAGNENDDVQYYAPAYYSEAFTVAATDINDRRAAFSNYGDSVNIAAPGVDIKSSIPGGNYARYDGTSMATPLVAACAALLKTSNNLLSPSDIKAILTTYADDMGSTKYYGAGIVNIVGVTPTDIGTPVTGVSLDKDGLSLLVGEEGQLFATIMPDNATNKSLEWRSGNPSVAAVDSEGNIKALSPGDTVVSVRTNDGNHTSECLVTVSPVYVPVTGVVLNKKNLSLFPGENERLATVITPQDATDSAVVWASSDASVANVSPNGEVTALRTGKAAITVQTLDGGFKAICAVTVLNDDEPITGLSLNKESLTLSVGEEERLIVTVTPAYATNPRVIWRSDDRTVAIVTQEGEVKASGPGSTVITVHTFDEMISSTCHVTVVP
jgi:uncharacterized protein YjdB